MRSFTYGSGLSPVHKKKHSQTNCRFSCDVILSQNEKLQILLGRVVRDLVKAKKGLKVNQGITFSCMKLFLLLMFCVV